MIRALQDAVAVVTGGGQGVGRGVALALAAEGARVAVVGRTLSKCESVVADIEARGDRAVALQCDVTSRSSVDQCVTQIHAHLGQVQILVNAAQSMSYGSVRRITEEALEDIWQSGFVGALRFMQSCFEDLRATKGVVINFGSGASLNAPAAMGGYASVKEAVRTLSRTAAVEWGKHGIRVNVVCPLAESPGYDDWSGDLGGAGDQLTDQIPLGRLGHAESDIGRACVFLVGSAAQFITGTTLMVDGGYQYLR